MNPDAPAANKNAISPDIVRITEIVHWLCV